MRNQRSNQNQFNSRTRLIDDALPDPGDILEMSGTETGEKIIRGIINAAIVSAIPSNPITAGALGVSRMVSSLNPSPEIGPPLIANPETLGDRWINLDHSAIQLEKYAAIEIASIPSRFIDYVADSLFQMGKDLYHTTADQRRLLMGTVEDIAKKTYGIIVDYAPIHIHRLAVESFVGPMGYLPAMVEMAWKKRFGTDSTMPAEHFHSHYHTHGHTHVDDHTHTHHHTHVDDHYHTHVDDHTHHHTQTVNVTHIHTDTDAGRALVAEMKQVKEHLVRSQTLASQRLSQELEKQTRLEWIGSAGRLEEASSRAGFKELSKWAGAARAGLEIHHAVRSLQTMGTMTLAAAAPCFLNIVSAGLMLMSLFGSDDSDEGLSEAFNALFQQLEYVSRQVENLRWEMHDRFDQLEYGIRTSFNQLFHFLRRTHDITQERHHRTHYDTSVIQKKIDFVTGLLRYSFDQTILLELSRSLYRIESDRPMDDETFRSTMETLEYWILRTPGLEVFNGSILHSDGVSSEQLSRVSDAQSMLGYLALELKEHGLISASATPPPGALRPWLEITKVFVTTVEKSKGRYDDSWAVEEMIRQARDFAALLRVLTDPNTINSYHDVVLSAQQALHRVLKEQLLLIRRRPLEDLALERQEERDRIQMLGPHKNRSAAGSGEDHKRYVSCFDDILSHQETSTWGPVFVIPSEKQSYDFHPVPLVASKLGIPAKIPKAYRQAVKLGLGKVRYEYTVIGGNTVCVAHGSSNQPMSNGRYPVPFYPWGHNGSIQSGSVGEYLGNSIGNPTIDLVIQVFYTPNDAPTIKIGHYVATGYHQHHPCPSSDAMSRGAYAIVQAFHQHPPTFAPPVPRFILRWRKDPPKPVKDYEAPVVTLEKSFVDKVTSAKQDNKSHQIVQVEATPEWIHHKEIFGKKLMTLRWLRELAGYSQSSGNPLSIDTSIERGESAGEMVIGRLSELENLLTIIHYRRQNCFSPVLTAPPSPTTRDPLETATREDLIAMICRQNDKIDAIYQMILARQ